MNMNGGSLRLARERLQSLMNTHNASTENDDSQGLKLGHDHSANTTRLLDAYSLSYFMFTVTGFGGNGSGRHALKNSERSKVERKVPETG